jgi:hypothetical protein
MKFKNYKSAIENNVFVDEAVSELINNGCIQEVPFQPSMKNLNKFVVQYKYPDENNQKSSQT